MSMARLSHIRLGVSCQAGRTALGLNNKPALVVADDGGCHAHRGFELMNPERSNGSWPAAKVCESMPH